MRVTADIMLQQWGIWQRQGIDRLGYRSPAGALIDQMIQGGGPAQIWIGEEEAERCDRIVTRLGRTDRLCADVLIAYYCTGRTQHAVGRVLGISRRRVGELLESGRMYIQSELDARSA